MAVLVLVTSHALPKIINPPNLRSFIALFLTGELSPKFLGQNGALQHSVQSAFFCCVPSLHLGPPVSLMQLMKLM